MPRRLTDEEIRSICEDEISSSLIGGDISHERAIAMDRYNGEPLGNEEEDRSQVRTREVLDTVEFIKPSLMRIFADAENIVSFAAVGPEDVEAAEQETEGLKHYFWHENNGFYNLLSFIHDGLLQKTGILKVWWDDTPVKKREEYKGLNLYELTELLANSGEYEILEGELNDDNSIDIVLMCTKDNGTLRIEPCPPEEFGVSRDARSPYPGDQDFVWHRTRTSKAELLAMGYDEQTVRELPTAQGDIGSEERIARRQHAQEREDYGTNIEWQMDKVWLTECYPLIDRDGDGVAERLKVSLVGASGEHASGSVLLDIEDVDDQPFVAWSPIIRTHVFHGLSPADLVIDIQEIRTTLLRQILDNVYLANANERIINERANVEDFLTTRPGGLKRVSGTDPVEGAAANLQFSPLPPAAMETYELMDELRKSRTGVGSEVGALEGNDLARINTGVAALAYDAARSKLELMARVCAEIGLKPLFLRMHKLMRQNSVKETMIQLRGKWTQVRPQHWRERTDMRVHVGVGQVSRERRLVALGDILEKQAAVLQSPFAAMILNPMNVYQALSDYAKELGLEESLYWQDPRQAPPPPQEGPDYQMAALQIQREQTQVLAQRNQVEALKVQADERMRIAELQQKERERILRAQIEQLKADVVTLKGERERVSDEAKQMLDARIAENELQLEQAKLALDGSQETAKREVELYKALLASQTTLTQEQMRILKLPQAEGAPPASAEASVTVETLHKAMTQLASVTANIQQSLERRSEPKRIVRDAAGNIIAIGEVRVRYGVDGQMESIG